MFVNPSYCSIPQPLAPVVITSSKGSQSSKGLLPKYVEDTPLGEDPTYQRVHTVLKEAQNRWKVVAVVVTTAMFIGGLLIGLSYYNYGSPLHMMREDGNQRLLANGDLVYVRLKNGHYLRADEKDMIVTSDFPWLQGSRFIIGK